MDDDGGLNMRNWTYYDHHYNKPTNLNLHLFPSIDSRVPKPFPSIDSRVPKPFLGRENSVMMNQNGGFHPRDCLVSESPMHMDPVRDSWVNSRERYVQHMFLGNSGYGGFLEHPPPQTMQILPHQQQPPELTKDAVVLVEDSAVKKEGRSPTKKRQNVSSPKPPKAKKPRKGPSGPKENGNSSNQRPKPAKKSVDLVINGMDLDISGIPIPVCSCTGTPQQCYRWGCGGWQSACCTTTISMYPLPMSTKRRGSRIAGRKMSLGAFKKVLEKLAAENYNFADAIDLKSHWAKHGTNKFVTIR